MSSVSNSLVQKRTTQKAALEPLLAKLRSAKARPWVKGKTVLDFGCGADLWNLRSIDGLAKERYGFDILFSGQPPRQTHDNITLVGNLHDIDGKGIDCVLSLACFEHLEPEELHEALVTLKKVTKPGTIIFGTVPTPLGKPVLEFLSYKLGIIDRSQIEDHKVYYDRALLSQAVSKAGWRLTRYRRFQLGMNSWFTLES